MKHEFIITSKGNYDVKTALEKINISNNLVDFYANKEDVYKDKNILIFIQGFVLPRHNIFNDYKKYNQYEIVKQLYINYENDFIRYLKGNFNIVLIDGDKVIICNDIHSIYRFYYSKTSQSFFISNSFKSVAHHIKPTFNEMTPAIFALFQHFVNGETMFKEIKYSVGATFLSIKDEIYIDIYWEIASFFNGNKNQNTLSDFVTSFDSNICNYLEYFNPNKVLMTLTGGRDTRSILASLLKNKNNPIVFTFGYPQGLDVTTSKNIAEQLNLEFHNPYIIDLNSKTYNLLADEIVKFDNQFIHIHRAHRLDAIKKEKEKIGKIDLLFMGAMGGDYIKGVSFNDYIITEFVRRFIFENLEPEALIKEILAKNFIFVSDKLINDLIEFVKSLDFLNQKSFKEKELFLAYKLIGSTHDIQDINIFSNFVNNVILPFMDVDIMETLFQSNFSLLSNDRSSKNILKKLSGGELQANLILQLFPKLGKIPFANQYTAKDVLGNKYVYLLKRVYLSLFKVKKDPTFSYDAWFQDFVKNNFENIDNDLLQFYNVEEMKLEFQNGHHGLEEGDWHKFTNIINLSKYYQSFKL